MWRGVSINAYDMLDEVKIVARVTQYDGSSIGGTEEGLSVSTTVNGVGAGDDSTWLRDLLVALAEMV
jgi:hypothetical protein